MCSEDVAMLTTATPMSIVPMRIAADGPHVGLLLIVGFGIRDPDGSDFGIKRTGRVVNDACWFQNVASICYRETKAHQLNCFADSGGALIWSAEGEQPVLLGILRATYGPCGIATRGAATRISLPSYGIAFDPSSSFNPPVDYLPIRQLSGELNADLVDREISFEIPPQLEELRVNLNYSRATTMANQFVLGLPTTSDGYCSNDYESVSVCVLHDPSPGPFTVRIARNHGEGEYQLTIVGVRERRH